MFPECQIANIVKRRSAIERYILNNRKMEEQFKIPANTYKASLQNYNIN